ncbi:hypothetical protein ACIQKE_36115 [Streptomyces griseoviridis]|uniref:Transmembrane protein n=1 Tax=Streptomyces griseoviridis TaxID=45398 RepID=A0A3Q9KWK9_STRGD|nr:MULTISPECIES: hypothetical protein [Streptomyces]AZS86223.1 hypothetical protein ELQ87_19555 [Streptomyces griseoviridis]MDH6700693.1 hypothetical protein [Streptomyces sp. MAA16]QCN86914.1 hypothetical protein DDJ31_19730 [Streptomyces griseoviridis]
MHMNSVPQYLLNEDRQDFERILDEALRSAPHRQDQAALGHRFNPEQLRTKALNATESITSAAATEYQHYVKVREEQRRPAPATASAGPSSAHDSDLSEPGATGLAASLDDPAETSGAGAVAVVAVLAPVLAGTAALIFLLVGYLLKMVSPGLGFARTMITAGWVFGAVTAAAILGAAVGLLLTALRNQPKVEAGAPHGSSEEVDRARDAWRDALLERGILPFLRDTLADPGTPAPTAVRPPRTTPAPAGRMPQLGYGRPGFSSRDDDQDSGHRPRFSSPDYSSPDFGGPENQPD